MMKKYYEPTPKKWRKLGDSLLAASTIMSLGGVWQFENLREIFTDGEIKIVIIAPMILGVVGKFLTNFFSTESEQP
jgi:hypothetical protein